MSTLSRRIEAYLIRMLEGDRTGQIEIRRSDLAQTFQCVPSQINYVLETRFTEEKGYVVESRRGGGGYIRITSLAVRRSYDVASALYRQIGNEIDEAGAEAVLAQLIETGALDKRRATLMRAALRREVAAYDMALRPRVRATLLRGMLLVVLA